MRLELHLARRLIALVLVSLGAAYQVGLADAQSAPSTISFVSDTSWPVFSTTTDGSLGSPLGTAQCVCQVQGWPCYWSADLSSIPGSCWIWMPGVGPNSPADLQGASFSKTFDLAGPPISGSIWVAVDDFADVVVNGSLVGSTGSVTDYGSAAGAQRALKQFDLTAFLRSGQNVITIRAQNGPARFAGGRCDPCSYSGNEAGLVFGGTLMSTRDWSSSICATQVAEFAPGTIDFGFGVIDTVRCAAVPAAVDASCLLGPPDLRFCSLGELGRVTLRFATPIGDGPGEDFVVYGSCNANNEPAEVLVSEDGVAFVSLGRFDHGVSMGFDLARVGLALASYVRIQDLPGGVYAQGSGFDLDAICALNTVSPVPTSRTTWGQLKVRYK